MPSASPTKLQSLSVLSTRETMIKVPAVTGLFWVLKLLTTATGETSSDFLVKTLDPAIAIPLGAIALALALGWQYSKDRYTPWVYWLAVLMVAVFGTMAADALHVGGGVPYAASTAFFSMSLAAVFFSLAAHRGNALDSQHQVTAARNFLLAGGDHDVRARHCCR